MSQAGIASINNSSSGFVRTLTGDSGVATASGENINVLGSRDLFFTGSGSTLQGTNQTKETPYVVGATGYAYSTIQSAIDACFTAGGGLVLITKGTYTENLTLKIGVALRAAEANVDSLNVNIIGTHTPDTSNGIISFAGINFFGTTSIFSSSAAGQCYMAFQFCNWILSGSGYIFDMLNWVGPTGLVPGSNGVGAISSGDLSTGASGFLRNTAGMKVALIDSYIGSYVGGGSLPLIVSGRIEIAISDVYCPIQIQGGTGSFIENTGIHRGGITVSGSSSGLISNCSFDDITDAAFTMSSSGDWSISSTTIDTSNNPAIAGSGSGILTIGGITFLDNANVAVTLTLAGATGFAAANLQNHGLILGRGARPLTALGIATNGQIPIGSTGNDPVLATITAGTGIAITNAAGSITISTAGAGISWTDVTSATQTLAIDNGYITNRGGGVTYTLPATATEGDVIRVAGKSGAWTIAQNANQQINVGSSSSTVGVTGSIASTNAGDCVELLCTTGGASTVWRSISFVGNLTVT